MRNGNPLRAPASQYSADLRIACKVIPNQAGSANAMVEAAKQIAKGRLITIVGHSLGGGLAQVVGKWQLVPFLSLNGPGMRGSLRFSAVNIIKPKQLRRSRDSGDTDDALGLSLRIEGDMISGYGAQVGYEVILDAPEGLARHDISTIGQALDEKGVLDQSPKTLMPEWPDLTQWQGGQAYTGLQWQQGKAYTPNQGAS
jgi:hypothetical protein